MTEVRQLIAAERAELDFMAWYLWNKVTPECRRIVNGLALPWPDAPLIRVRIEGKKEETNA